MALILLARGQNAFSSKANSAGVYCRASRPASAGGRRRRPAESASGRVTATMIHQRDRGIRLKGMPRTRQEGQRASAATPQQPPGRRQIFCPPPTPGQMDGLNCRGKPERMSGYGHLDDGVARAALALGAIGGILWWFAGHWWRNSGDSGAGALVWHGSRPRRRARRW